MVNHTDHSMMNWDTACTPDLLISSSLIDLTNALVKERAQFLTVMLKNLMEGLAKNVQGFIIVIIIANGD